MASRDVCRRAVRRASVLALVAGQAWLCRLMACRTAPVIEAAFVWGGRVLVERPGPAAATAVAVDPDVTVVVFLKYQGKSMPLGLGRLACVARHGQTGAIGVSDVDAAFGEVLREVADEVSRVDRAKGGVGAVGAVQVVVNKVFQRFDQNHGMGLSRVGSGFVAEGGSRRSRNGGSAVSSRCCVRASTSLRPWARARRGGRPRSGRVSRRARPG